MKISTFERLVAATQHLRPRSLALRAGEVVGGWAMRRVPDRRYLERVILPELARERPRAVLFVGVSRVPDTRGYEHYFDAAATSFWTLDIAADAAPYGARRNHVRGDIRDAPSLFAAARFDCVIITGVFGFGLDAVDSQDRAVAAAHEVLAPGGRLILGWNERRCPDPLHLVAIGTLFDRDRSRPRLCFNGTDHVFDFFVRRESRPAVTRPERLS